MKSMLKIFSVIGTPLLRDKNNLLQNKLQLYLIMKK